MRRTMTVIRRKMFLESTLAGDYINLEFSNDSLVHAKSLLNDVMDSMKRRIQGNSWLDNKTISKSVEKMEAISAKVGYPHYVFNLTYLQRRYDNVDVVDSDFFFNNVRLDRHYRRRYLQKLGSPVEKEKWTMLPQTVNAMYQFFQNDIVIPAGILRPPFFYPDGSVPQSLNYGAIGAVIGHEITHAFDSTGRKFDMNGLIVKEWWSGESVKEFNQRAICFQEQYSQYVVSSKVNVNGWQTMAENIADNGGILAALKALNDSRWGKELRTSIGGRELNSAQLFFVAFAQGYCSKSKEEYQEVEALLQAHSPSRYRVIGTLSNIPAFAEAFSCKPGTPMNPTKKCCIW